jgi:ceramide glucosyltransferase
MRGIVLALAPFLLQRVASLYAVARFGRLCGTSVDEPAAWPAVTILKPLCGDEPGLEAAIESFLALDYPQAQFIFGVHDDLDPAAHIVKLAAKQHCDLDISLVAKTALPSANRKIANLLNMLPQAKHDILLISDSDMHVQPDYLRRVISELQVPGTGLVTSPYTGAAMNTSLAARLGALQINGTFMPGAILGFMLGRQDCLGATMALRRVTLDAIGGLGGIGRYVADDAQLGLAIRRMGLRVGVAATVPVTAVAETTIASLLSHELRWAVTIRSLAPFSFAASILQYPLPFVAGIALICGDHATGVALLLGVWAWQGMSAQIIYWVLRLPAPGFGLLIPVREAVSVCILIASYFQTRVTWRGHHFAMSRPTPLKFMLRLWTFLRGLGALEKGTTAGTVRRE